MQDLATHLGLILLAYGLGSLPFAVWITRWRTGRDVRQVGSGHSGATNAMRAAGWAAGAAVAVLDVGKGWVAVELARRGGTWAATPALAAAAVVIGHCWPILAGFRGGMGVATGAGALAAMWPMGAALAVVAGIVVQFLVRHTARGNVVTGLVVGPMWALAGAPLGTALAAAAAGLVVSVRSASDWARVYGELWLDRPSQGAAENTTVGSKKKEALRSGSRRLGGSLGRRGGRGARGSESGRLRRRGGRGRSGRRSGRG
jgi:glycerol-3-phosphate acyltransferase PlsY